MRKQLTMLGVCLLFITLCFSGCEVLEDEPDYITVVCSATIGSMIWDKTGNDLLTEKPVGLAVDIEFIKAGGERFSFKRTLNGEGYAETGTCSFKLYKEQNIEAVMRVQGGYKNYTISEPYKFGNLAWSVVEPVGFGNTYTWQVPFFVDLRNTSGP